MGRLRWSHAAVMAIGLVLARGGGAVAQLPNLPIGPKPAATPKDNPAVKPVAAPTKDNPEAVFATTSGPIQVTKKVDDAAVKSTLDDMFVQYPGVRRAVVKVRNGVVTLDGQVDDRDKLEEVTEIARKVEGVRMVLNRMKTDDQVLTGRQMAHKVMGEFAFVVERYWLLAIVAVAVGLGFAGLARLFARYSETLLAPFIRNVLLRSVVGSLISSVIVLAGVMLGLSVLNLTRAVASVLGLAGVVTLAIGFAFRDIAENFIASILLGTRRPFQIGDYITVAGKSGSVLSLTTRATELITPEGHHVRIPNAVIYKETLVNSTTAPTVLGTTELVIPYEMSTATAMEAITEALNATEGLIQSPAPRVLVQALETEGVRLKATYWMPTKGVDGDKMQSDLRLRIKVGLQKAGISPPVHYTTLSVTGRIPVELLDATKRNNVAGANGHAEGHETVLRPGSTVTARQAEANLRKDAQATETAAATALSETEPTPIEHAIQQAVASGVGQDGNLLAKGS